MHCNFRGVMIPALSSSVHSRLSSLKRKCRHFGEIFITDCTGSCHFYNFQCSQWWNFRQRDDISVSVVMTTCGATCDGKVGIITTLCLQFMHTNTKLVITSPADTLALNGINMHSDEYNWVTCKYPHIFVIRYVFFIHLFVISFFLSLSIYSFLCFGYVVSSWWIHVINLPIRFRVASLALWYDNLWYQWSKHEAWITEKFPWPIDFIIWSSNELQWVDLNIGLQDSSPSNGRQGDLSHSGNVLYTAITRATLNEPSCEY